MFFLLRSLLMTLLGLLLLVGLFVSQIVDLSPNSPLDWQPNQQMAKDIFHKASEQSQTKHDLTFDQRELNHILNSLLNRYLDSNTQLTFQDENVAIVTTSLQLPKKLYGYFLNIRFELHNDQHGLQLTQLTIGRITLPSVITQRIVNHLLQHSFLRHYYHLGVQHVKSIQINHKQLVASYELKTIGSGLANINTLDPATLSFYQDQITLITQQHNSDWRLSLADLLSPLFKIAAQRSSLQNATTDNIAIIYAVSSYVNHNDMPFYLAIKPAINQTVFEPVYLYKRTDQAKHFMLSAVLTISGGTQLADIMGQEKELRDAQTKSGFSFIDLAADRAGMKFSQQAIQSPASAKALQNVMAHIKDYREFMPEVQDLPEKLTQTQFSQRFDGIGSPSYKAIMQQIDDRIMQLPLYAHP